MDERDRLASSSVGSPAEPPSAVRVLPAASVPDALTAAAQAPRSQQDHAPRVVRVERFDDLRSAVDELRAGRAVVLALEGLGDASEQRRALAFVGGAAYALDANVARHGADACTFLVDPDAASDGSGQTEVVEEAAAEQKTCALCDLRTADREFNPPMEQVIRRDGSRVWSPPASVCSHCRATIRHWQFALAWCSECERWGRRNVVSPCGQLYG